MTKDIFITGLKILLSVAVIILALMAWTAEINRAMAASSALKINPVVTGDQIRLGDVFSHTGENADHALAPAPQPGQSITWTARTLMRVSQAFQLGWRPVSASTSITIRRDGQLIGEDIVKNTVLTALYDAGEVGERMQINLDSPVQIVLPSHAQTDLMITSLDYTPITRKVRADLSPVDPLVNTTYRISGTLQRVIPVPTLRATMRKGDIIGEYDVEWMDVPETHIQPDMVVSAEDIVGMTPRRFISVGQIVRFSDLDKPKLVKRGEPVTITYTNGRISLSAMGKALENGAKGHVIEVANKSSNRTIQAVVTGTREVTVLR